MKSIMWWGRNLGLVMALALLLAACGTSTPEALVLGDPVWQAGERSEYRVTNREDVVAGSAVIEINAAEDASAEDAPDGDWVFRRVINDIGVSETATVTVQSLGYLPLHSLTVRSTGNASEIVEADHERGQVDIAITNQQGATVYERVNVPSDSRDERTLLPLLRTLPLRRGYAANINSVYPLTGFTERFSIRILGSEEVTVPAGTFDTWQIELRTTDRTTRAWVGQEAPHPLVRFIEGRSQATFELSTFSAGGEN